jgi:hypothetical protein
MNDFNCSHVDINAKEFKYTRMDVNGFLLWDVVACNLVETETTFRGAYCLHHQGECDRGSKHL